MSQTKVNLLGVAAMGALAFMIIGSYELARPAAESLFLETYGSGHLPYVWLAVAGTAAAVVSLYNRLSKGHHLLTVLATVSLVAAALVVVGLVLLRLGVPGAEFALYVFKDVYIVVLIEIFWSFSNVVFRLRTARWIYGLFCLMGSAGGAIMNLVSGEVAKAFADAEIATLLAGRTDETAGTVLVLWVLVPVLGVIAISAAIGARWSPGARPDLRAADLAEPPGFLAGLSTVRRSPYLVLMLVLIASTQLAITLIDFQFNQGVEVYQPDTNLRTALIGQVYFAINLGAAILQLLTGPILRIVGVRRAIPSIPAMLGATVLAFTFAPQVGLLAAAKVLSKVLDYSVFRAAKEMLYIPLTYIQKTEGKAVIDMLTYRVAKGVASLLILALAAWSAPRMIGLVTLGVIAIWVVVSLALVRRYALSTNDEA